MIGKKLVDFLACVSVLAVCALLASPQEVSRSISKNAPHSEFVATQQAETPLVVPPGATSGSPQNTGALQSVETPMATAERLETPGWWPTKHSAPRQDFVGTAECARCHAKKAATQITTPMAHASMPAASSSVLKEHEPISRRVGAFTYTISSGPSGEIYSASTDGKSISEPLLWAFGVDQKGQTYIYQRAGSYHESRMSFFKGLQTLDVTPGHEPAAPAKLDDALGRVLEPSTLRLCFGCHTTASTTSAGFDPSHLMPGVTCEACHGPGAEHVLLMDDDRIERGRAAIFNPKRLSPIALVDFCGACHRTLNDVVEMATAGVENVRFQPYRLESSRCWGDGDARLTCIACHDPHQPVVHDAGSYDAKCLACHVLSGSTKTKTSSDHLGKACPVGKRNCVTCHMPRVDLANMHAPFTDHRIRIVRRGQPYPD